MWCCEWCSRLWQQLQVLRMPFALCRAALSMGDEKTGLKPQDIVLTEEFGNDRVQHPLFETTGI
jgi:hypothetical protein